MLFRRIAFALSLLLLAVAGCCLLSRDDDSHSWSFDDDVKETTDTKPTTPEGETKEGN